jgi:hypothetical protein
MKQVRARLLPMLKSCAPCLPDASANECQYAFGHHRYQISGSRRLPAIHCRSASFLHRPVPIFLADAGVPPALCRFPELRNKPESSA